MSTKAESSAELPFDFSSDELDRLMLIAENVRLSSTDDAGLIGRAEAFLRSVWHDCMASQSAEQSEGPTLAASFDCGDGRKVHWTPKGLVVEVPPTEADKAGAKERTGADFGGAEQAAG